MLKKESTEYSGVHTEKMIRLITKALRITPWANLLQGIVSIRLTTLFQLGFSLTTIFSFY